MDAGGTGSVAIDGGDGRALGGDRGGDGPQRLGRAAPGLAPRGGEAGQGRRHRVPRKRVAGGLFQQTPPLTDAQLAHAIALYARGFGIGALARRLAHPETAIRRELLAAGVRLRTMAEQGAAGRHRAGADEPVFEPAAWPADALFEDARVPREVGRPPPRPIVFSVSGSSLRALLEEKAVEPEPYPVVEAAR